MKNITLVRLGHSSHSTWGVLEAFDTAVFTLEDARRPHKIAGETRIPRGKYELSLRTEGGMTQRYSERFPNDHKGMIWLRDVPMFEFVYIHIGNTPQDTEGCILVGETRQGDTVYSSKKAYFRIYSLIVDAIENGGCTLTIFDELAR